MVFHRASKMADQNLKLFLERYPEYTEKISILMKGGHKHMDVTNWTKAAGSFLKPEDVKKNPNASFVIRDEGQFQKSEKFGNDQFLISGEYSGEEKIFTCSKTNARTIEKILGSDSKKWIGHSVTFELYKTKTSDGKLVDALNVATVK